MEEVVSLLIKVYDILRISYGISIFFMKEFLVKLDEVCVEVFYKLFVLKDGN